MTSYIVCLYTGSKPDLNAQTFINITPESSSVEDMISSITHANISAADLKAKTVISLEGDVERSVLMYALITGFAGRRIDFMSDGVLVDSNAMYSSVYDLVKDLEKPELLPEFTQIGKEATEGVYWVDLNAKLSLEDLFHIRFSKRVRISIDDITTNKALTTLITAAAIRNRNGSDRFPVLVKYHNDTLFTSKENEDEPVAFGNDLEQIRRKGNEMRRENKLDDRSTVVSKEELTDRLEIIDSASKIDISKALIMLGSEYNADTDFWRCPRPARHKNGDANPSMKIIEGKVRCFRCDQEPVDAVRLIVDTLNLTADDAARILNR